jgi:protein SCO1/2
MRKELLLAATLAVGAITACEAGTPIPVDPALSGHPALPRIRPAPEFALKDVDGVPVSLAGIGPKVRLVSFVYTSCSAACPLLTERMARLQQAVAEAGRAGDVELVSITVDPLRDDPTEMRAFGRRFGADPSNWKFLTDRPEAIRPVLVAYDEWSSELTGGTLDHPARVHLIDRNGVVREIYSLSYFDERQAVIDVLTLADEPAS